VSRTIRDASFVILFSGVITKLGDLTHINPKVIESLFSADLAFLQDFYQRINQPEFPFSSFDRPITYTRPPLNANRSSGLSARPASLRLYSRIWRGNVRPTHVNLIHDLFCPPDRIRYSADRGRHARSSVVLSKPSRSKNAGRYGDRYAEHQACLIGISSLISKSEPVATLIGQVRSLLTTTAA